MKKLEESINNILVSEAKKSSNGIESDTVGTAVRAYAYGRQLDGGHEVKLDGVLMSSVKYFIASPEHDFDKMKDLYKSDKSEFKRLESEFKKDTERLETEANKILKSALDKFDKEVAAGMKKLGLKRRDSNR